MDTFQIAASAAAGLLLVGGLAIFFLSRRTASRVPTRPVMGKQECTDIKDLLKQVDLPEGWTAKLLSLIADKSAHRLLRIVIADADAPRMNIDCRRDERGYTVAASLPDGIKVMKREGPDLCALICEIADTKEFDAFLFGKTLPSELAAAA